MTTRRKFIQGATAATAATVLPLPTVEKVVAEEWTPPFIKRCDGFYFDGDNCYFFSTARKSGKMVISVYNDTISEPARVEEVK